MALAPEEEEVTLGVAPAEVLPERTLGGAVTACEEGV